MAKYLERMINTAVKAVLSKADNGKIFGEYYKRTEAASKLDWTKQPTNFTSKTIDDWVTAVMAATATDDPRRGLLMRFFASLKLDLHLLSCIDGRILPIQCAPFKLIDKSKKEDEEAHKLFEKPWFLDLIKLICNHTFEGTKLIEMIELNDKGELNCVTEIPQSNFLPVKGLVIKEEYDTTGVSYKSGVYANYYVQIGNDYTLGMLNELAMIVLAKKLGLGSWMSYIEKFGVPAIFVVTDRMDDTRAQELFKMLQSFRSNHFGILKGSEKVEIPKDANSDGYQSFDKLNLFCDSQMSKRILGGTGITDEKSFVGAAEIHERQLKYRIQVDKLILKFYLNEEIIPRLVKLSSAYAPLANLTFEWDETETLTLKEKIQTVKDLAPYYDFDAEKLAELTGLPITNVKQVLTGAPDPNNTQKKKPSATVIGAKNYVYAPLNLPFFQGEYPKGEGFGVRGSVFAATWDAAIERLATQLYNGEIKPSDLDKDLVLKNYSALSKSAESAYGKGYYENELTRKMRDNLMKFSGAKSYNLMTKLNALNTGGITKEAYIEKAKLIVVQHNETYQKVENTYTASCASAAKDWEQFVKDKDIYPNLKYRTMEDAYVREAHVILDGTVKAVDDPFWNTYMPPNGFRCRCWTEQTTEDASTETPKLEMPEMFRNNPGKDGTVFNYQNSYQQSITPKDKNVVENNMQLMKQYAPYSHIIDTSAENKVFVSDFYDGSDLSPNVVAATQVANYLNTNVYVRPHTYSTNGYKNPEYGIGKPNILGDLKTFDPEKSKSIDGFLTNSFKDCAKKRCKYAVCDISLATQTDIDNNLVRRLYGSLKADKDSTIEQVIIIRGKKTAKISRKQIAKLDFADLMKHL